MKILQVNNFFDYGSTGKLTTIIHRGLLEQGHESLVCYGRGAKTQDKNAVKICSELYSKINNVRSRITGIMYGGFALSTRRLMDIIRQEKPDVVHLQCINCFFVNIYEIIEWLKQNRVKTVLTLHAEFMYTANCGHALDCEKWRTGCGNCPRYRKETRSLILDGTHRSFAKMQKAFEGFEKNLTVVSVSPWLRDRAVQSPILKDMRHEVILNGVDATVFHPRECEELRRKHGIGDRKVVFHATPSFSDDPSHLKGGRYVLELAKRMQDLRVVFLVAGEYHLGVPVPDNVILLGNVANQELLARYYSMADATLMTSKRETFSLVCAESLCCGTPVFGFKAGGPEMISLKDFSRFVENGDIESLQNLLTEYLYGEKLDENTVAREAARIYSKETMLNRYISLYEKICREKDTVGQSLDGEEAPGIGET